MTEEMEGELEESASVNLVKPNFYGLEFCQYIFIKVLLSVTNPKIARELIIFTMSPCLEPCNDIVVIKLYNKKSRRAKTTHLPNDVRDRAGKPPTTDNRTPPAEHFGIQIKFCKILLKSLTLSQAAQ